MSKKLQKESVFTKLTYIFIALMLTVFLFWADSTGYTRITEAKLPVFRALCGGYVIAVIVLVPSCLLTGLIKRSDVKRFFTESTLSQKLAAVFMLLTLASGIFSQYGSRTWQGVSRYEGSETICIYCLCFIFVSSFGRVKGWMKYLFGASVLLLSVLSILQLAGLNPFGLYPDGMNYYGSGTDYNGSYLATIGNTDLLSAFLCIAVPILWVSVLRSKDKFRYILLIPLLAALYVLIRMDVLAGILGVFGGAVLSLPMTLKISDKTAKLIAIIIIAVIILALIFIFFADFNIPMLHEAHELLHGRADDSFGTGRIYIWNNVLQRVPDHLLFGAGPDTMSLSGIEPFTRYDPVKNVKIVSEIDTAHNEYLNVLYHQGVFALIAYVAMLAVLAVRWIKKGRDNTGCAVLGCAVLCYCIQAFFGISMFLTAPFFWITLGLLDASCRN